MKRFHVIPVPRGYDPMDAWWEIKTFGRLRLPWWRVWLGRRAWVVVEEEVDDATYE